MHIDIDTKYNIGDKVWTNGWKFADHGKEEHPVLVEIYSIDVGLRDADSCLSVMYSVMPVEILQNTLVWNWVDGRPGDTKFPEHRFEADLFRTSKEALAFIKESIPF